MNFKIDMCYQPRETEPSYIIRSIYKIQEPINESSISSPTMRVDFNSLTSSPLTSISPLYGIVHISPEHVIDDNYRYSDDSNETSPIYQIKDEVIESDLTILLDIDENYYYVLKNDNELFEYCKEKFSIEFDDTFEDLKILKYETKLVLKLKQEINKILIDNFITNFLTENIELLVYKPDETIAKLIDNKTNLYECLGINKRVKIIELNENNEIKLCFFGSNRLKFQLEFDSVSQLLIICYNSNLNGNLNYFKSIDFKLSELEIRNRTLNKYFTQTELAVLKVGIYIVNKILENDRITLGIDHKFHPLLVLLSKDDELFVDLNEKIKNYGIKSFNLNLDKETLVLNAETFDINEILLLVLDFLTNELYCVEFLCIEHIDCFLQFESILVTLNESVKKFYFKIDENNKNKAFCYGSKKNFDKIYEKHQNLQTKVQLAALNKFELTLFERCLSLEWFKDENEDQIDGISALLLYSRSIKTDINKKIWFMDTEHFRIVQEVDLIELKQIKNDKRYYVFECLEELFVCIYAYKTEIKNDFVDELNRVSDAITLSINNHISYVGCEPIKEINICTYNDKFKNIPVSNLKLFSRNLHNEGFSMKFKLKDDRVFLLCKSRTLFGRFVVEFSETLINYIKNDRGIILFLHPKCFVDENNHELEEKIKTFLNENIDSRYVDCSGDEKLIEEVEQFRSLESFHNYLAANYRIDPYIREYLYICFNVELRRLFFYFSKTDLEILKDFIVETFDEKITIDLSGANTNSPGLRCAITLLSSICEWEYLSSLKNCTAKIDNNQITMHGHKFTVYLLETYLKLYLTEYVYTTVDITLAKDLDILADCLIAHQLMFVIDCPKGADFISLIAFKLGAKDYVIDLLSEQEFMIDVSMTVVKKYLRLYKSRYCQHPNYPSNFIIRYNPAYFQLFSEDLGIYKYIIENWIQSNLRVIIKTGVTKSKISTYVTEIRPNINKTLCFYLKKEEESLYVCGLNEDMENETVHLNTFFDDKNEKEVDKAANN